MLQQHLKCSIGACRTSGPDLEVAQSGRPFGLLGALDERSHVSNRCLPVDQCRQAFGRRRQRRHVDAYVGNGDPGVHDARSAHALQAPRDGTQALERSEIVQRLACHRKHGRKLDELATCVVEDVREGHRCSHCENVFERKGLARVFMVRVRMGWTTISAIVYLRAARQLG